MRERAGPWREPTGVQVSVDGSYNSAPENPAIRTMPLGSSVREPKIVGAPVLFHVSVAGSNSSAPRTSFERSATSTASTLPFGSNTAGPTRTLLRLLLACHLPVAGSYSSAVLLAARPLLLAVRPPTTSTWELGNSIAV